MALPSARGTVNATVLDQPAGPQPSARGTVNATVLDVEAGPAPSARGTVNATVLDASTNPGRVWDHDTQQWRRARFMYSINGSPWSSN
jgi:hypothetical protein